MHINDLMQLFDRCGRAIAKLKNRGISDHMILGKSPADKKLMRDIMAKSTDEFSPPRKKKELGASDFTLDRDKLHENRSSGKTDSQ